MRTAGLEGRREKRWRTTTIADPAAERARDLIGRQFAPGPQADRRYVGDITYIPTWQGWAYLATVIDLASRKVVGWALADHMRTELVEDALSMAFTTRRPPDGVIFHSDRGCQYTSRDFAALARANGVVLSVSRKGECWDNAVAESFFATIKRELTDGRAWPTRAGLHRAVFDYIEGWYNTRRLHSSLNYLSPAEYEALHHNAKPESGMINTGNLIMTRFSGLGSEERVPGCGWCSRTLRGSASPGRSDAGGGCGRPRCTRRSRWRARFGCSIAAG
jgi:transposase InsO family protein